MQLAFLSVGVLVLGQACDSGTLTESTLANNTTGTLNDTSLYAVNANACDTHEIVGASSTFDHDANYHPGNVIDGDLDTESRWSSKGIGNSIVLDLGELKAVTAISVAFHKGYARDSYFDVETSQNGSSWNSILSDGVVSGTAKLQTFSTSESTARYVKIIGNGNEDTPWNSIIEAEVLGCSEIDTPVDPESPGTCDRYDNLSISSATSEEDYDANYKPSNVIDNNFGTESRWSSNGVGRSIVLDLGQTSTIRRINTAWYKADERAAFFDVRTSSNQSNWNTVLSQATASGSEGPLEFNVSDSEARYVEIVGLGNSVSNWSSLIEVDVYGCGETDETAPDVPPETDPPEDPPETDPPETDPPETGNVNVVFNGTFENSLSGWQQVEPAQGSSESHSGSGSGKVYESGSLSQSIFLSSQSSYRLSAWLQGDLTIGITVNGNTYRASGDSSSFSQVNLEFNTGNADTGTIFIQATSSSDSQRVDDIEVIKFSGNGSDTDPNTVFDFGIWEVEGESPITREGNMEFDALGQCVVTPNGNGCRHEQKVMTSERYGLTEQYEYFSANIETDLSHGSETIVVQHHPEATGTLAALYVSDTEDPAPDAENGIAKDGIFDLIVTVRRPGSTDNETVVLGTVRNGEPFNYQVTNDHGVMTITAPDKTVTLTSADSSSSYLKFGNYLQARDPVTRDRMELDKPLDSEEDRDAFLDYYTSKGITKSIVMFKNVIYQRTLD